MAIHRFFRGGTILPAKNKPNKLLQGILQNSIQSKGPISFAEYMELSLCHERYGYYSKNKIFGREGDFVTSPEVSQMFGELIGVWIASVYSSFDKPYRWNVIEIGPGRGTLSMDICRTLREIDCATGLNMHLIDISGHLRSIQQKNFQSLFERWNTPLIHESLQGVDRFFKDDICLHWYSALSDMKQYYENNLSGPLIFVAHELFDALPVHIFEFTEMSGWCELLVDFTDKFELVSSGTPNANVQKILNPHKRFSLSANIDLKEGDRIEVSAASSNLMCDICDMLNLDRGAALIVDYGEDHAFSDSIRGIKDHKKKDIAEWIQYPGEYDISAYVNFRLLRGIAETFPKLNVSLPVPQGFFLESMGILPRIEQLSQNVGVTQGKILEEQYERLVSPEQMGGIYKFMLASSKDLGEIYPFSYFKPS